MFCCFHIIFFHLIQIQQFFKITMGDGTHRYVFQCDSTNTLVQGDLKNIARFAAQHMCVPLSFKLPSLASEGNDIDHKCLFINKNNIRTCHLVMHYAGRQLRFTRWWALLRTTRNPLPVIQTTYT